MGKLTISSANDLVQAVEFLADMAVKSRFIKDLNKDQAKILSYTAIMNDVDLLDVLQTFDVIGTRLSKKAVAMLAEFKKRGGKYKILERSHDRAAIEFSYEGQTSTFELTWQQIKDEDYTRDRDGKDYKPRYKQPHSRMQMLWARLVSDSVRAICPEATGGYYTPEENLDIIDATEWKTCSAGALPAPSQPDPAISSAAIAATNTTTTAVATSQTVDDMITQDQQFELTNLFTLLGINQQIIDASLAKRNVTNIAELTSSQAVEIIGALRSRLASTQGQTSVNTGGPITQELEAKIQEAIKTCAQVEGGLAAVQSVQQHLARHGLGMHQLTLAQGETLLAAIQQRQVGLFLGLALSETQPGKA